MEFANEDNELVFLARDSEFESSILRKMPVDKVVQFVLAEQALMRFTENEKFHPVMSEYLMTQGTMASVARLTAQITAPDIVPHQRLAGVSETDTVTEIN